VLLHEPDLVAQALDLGLEADDPGLQPRNVLGRCEGRGRQHRDLRYQAGDARQRRDPRDAGDPRDRLQVGVDWRRGLVGEELVQRGREADRVVLGDADAVAPPLGPQDDLRGEDPAPLAQPRDDAGREVDLLARVPQPAQADEPLVGDHEEPARGRPDARAPHAEELPLGERADRLGALQDVREVAELRVLPPPLARPDVPELGLDGPAIDRHPLSSCPRVSRSRTPREGGKIVTGARGSPRPGKTRAATGQAPS
jgi:hypothetical protein